MGSCMSGDKKQSHSQYFKKDNNLIQKTQIYQPLYTTLFNTFRKYNDLIVIFSESNKAKQFSGVFLDDVKSLPPKSIKMMYSFKKVIIVGDYGRIQGFITDLNKSANISLILVISDKQFDRFQKSYNIYKSIGDLSQYATSKIPILVFNSQQFIRPPQKSQQIFIHSAQQKDKQVYTQLKIHSDNIIQPSKQTNLQKDIHYYIQRLKGSKGQRVCLLHNKSLNQNALMQVLSSYLMHAYQTSQISVKQYLSRSLPNVVIANHSDLMNQNMGSSKVLQQTSNVKSQLKTNVDQFHKLFKQHQSESNLQKTQRAYNLLGKLVANILSNPDDQHYRKVKGANKQMQQLLTRSNSGIKLLRLVGFNENNGFWVNELQSRYLKVLRTDMDLGYRNSITQNNKQ